MLWCYVSPLVYGLGILVLVSIAWVGAVVGGVWLITHVINIVGYCWKKIALPRWLRQGSGTFFWWAGVTLLVLFALACVYFLGLGILAEQAGSCWYGWGKK